nr:RNA-directed DNA polymerase, eukaryota [Tanacetum cinerariifolium]
MNKRPSHSVPEDPALVLDETYANDVDLSRHVMGRAKDLNSIPNLKIILTKEGFGEIKLSYLGGLWVMIELKDMETKKDLLNHIVRGGEGLLDLSYRTALAYLNPAITRSDKNDTKRENEFGLKGDH